MFHPDERFATALEAAVTAAEATTRAEIVVVAAPRSGRYDDLAWAVGAVTALGAYLLMFFSPITFDAMWIPLDLALVGGLTGWLVARSPGILRGLASAERRRWTHRRRRRNLRRRRPGPRPQPLRRPGPSPAGR